MNVFSHVIFGFFTYSAYGDYMDWGVPYFTGNSKSPLVALCESCNFTS